ncbi:uncharacterized protein KY384_009245 [Bacidia gigantensis]|uniref:uncharacterized protein n=1 Tax=Bacidia gigantensis TaxID=2732470 RepID=UPI001D03FD4E|nr:uncharacterized protein KY384_009245 [Bacidia gigantensis]KAG8525601.1 hypothetical protein KY384_009245 [Bacidia gigantensis]
MESAKEAEDSIPWQLSLKGPAVEVIDLLSREEDPPLVSSIKPEATRDASNENEDGTDGSDADSQLSLYADLLNADDNEEVDVNGGEACTTEESLTFRKRLRLLGERRFIEETIESGAITSKKLITAFGIRPPFFLEGQPDDAYDQLLQLAINRELSKRNKLPQYNTITDVVDLLQKSQNIIVLTGAGISTSLGIPDFRSKETGLYSQLAHLGLTDPQEVFDISLFREDPTIFYTVAKDIFPSSTKFSPTHAFIKLLQDKNKLLTNFTQNIDNLESHAGISKENLLQCHGSFATATCLECAQRVPGSAIHTDLKAGKVARCDACLAHIRRLQSAGVKRKRSPQSNGKPRKKRQEWEDSSSGEDDNVAVAGVMKPDITFFGEDLPDAFHERLLNHDRKKVDLVLVIGTSLKVAPVSEVVGVIPGDVPQVYINRDPCGHAAFDVDLLGNCDTIVTELCRRGGWELEHEMVSEEKVSVEMCEGFESRWNVKIENK